MSLKHHFHPPQGTFDPDPRLAWWIFKRLQDLVRQDFDNYIRVVRPKWADFEKRVRERQSAVEAEALRLWQRDPQSACAYLTEYCHELSTGATARAEKLITAIRDHSRVSQ